MSCFLLGPAVDTLSRLSRDPCAGYDAGYEAPAPAYGGGAAYDRAAPPAYGASAAGYDREGYAPERRVPGWVPGASAHALML